MIFRCSTLGGLMTGVIGLSPRQKETLDKYRNSSKPLTDRQTIEYGQLLEKEQSRDISATSKALLLENYLAAKYGYRKEVYTEAMQKGKMLEGDAIALLSEVKGKFLKKNKDRLKNDFIIGECDINHGHLITDIKVPEDFVTFASVTDIDKSYYWQGQGYMWLWGAVNYEITYVLMPDPEYIMYAKINRLKYLLTGDELDAATNQIISNNAVINTIPAENRIKTFSFDYNPDDIELLKEQIIRAREYASKLII